MIRNYAHLKNCNEPKKIKHESSKLITYYYYYCSWGNENVLFQNETCNFETAQQL